MNRLEKAKEVIHDFIPFAKSGIFDSRNTVGDQMDNLFHKDGLIIDICRPWEYFEVFGLTEEEFDILDDYYDALRYELDQEEEEDEDE